MSEQPNLPTDASGQWAELIDFPAPRPSVPEQSAEDTGEFSTVDAGHQGPEESDEERQAAEVVPRPEATPARRVGSVPPALASTGRVAWQTTKVVGRSTATAWRATSPHAKTGGVFVVRHSAFVLGGSRHLVRAAWRRVQHSEIDDAIRAARASGDGELVARLTQEKRNSANDRWKRVGTQLKVSGYVAVGTVGTWCAVTAGVAIWGGIAQLIPDGGDWESLWTHGWWAFNTGTVGFAAWVVSLWPWLLALGALAAGGTAWGLGRHQESVPTWAAPQRTHVPTDEVQVSADRLITALRNCGIPELKAAIKDGETAGLVDLISQYGPGVATTITLPRGIPASKLAEKAASLASSLSRGEHEVSISRSPSNNSKAQLWVARPGALDEPVPASPMMDPDYGPVDLYKDPVPWGHSPQGEPIELDLIQRHILIAGLSKQGKTASARALALHAAFDPSVEFRIADLKGVGDWSMFSGLASTLIEGAGEVNELATATMVERAAAEMDRRMAARRAKGAKGDITAAEARDGSGDHHPLIVLVDEVQIAYMSTATEDDIDEEGNVKPGKSPVGGQKNNSRLWQAAKKLHDQGRAVNIHLWQFAQNPTDRNLPAIVREGAHVRGSLYVSNPSIARKAIGDAPVDAGAAPDRLRSEIDAGTVVTAGAPEIVKAKGEMANTVRTHFIDTDPAHQVAERAKALRSAPVEAAAEVEQRDLLADVDTALAGEQMVKTKDVVSRLRQLAPTWQSYKSLDAATLEGMLKSEYGIKPGGKDGYSVVRLPRVQAALAEREVTDDED